MGIETIAIAALSVAAVGTATNYVAGQRAASAQKKAASSQQRLAEEGNAITQANNQNEARDARRQAMREERIRRAQILQAATTGGVGDSSGAIGAEGGVTTVTGTKVSDLGGALANADAMGDVAVKQAGVNSQLQRSLSSAASLSAIGGALTSIGSIGVSYAGTMTPKPSTPQPSIVRSGSGTYLP